MPLIKLIIISTFLFILASCTQDDNTIYVYQEACSGSMGNGVCDGSWFEVNEHKYVVNVAKQEVIGTTVGVGLPPDRYTNCTVADVNDWSCSFDDNSGTFGVSDGVYWMKDPWPDMRTISTFEHYVYQVQYFFDKF